MNNGLFDTNDNLINPIVLRWARRTIGYDEIVAASKLKVTVNVLRNWENGELAVPIKKLKLLAQVYKRPSVIFLLDREPVETIPPKFRRLMDSYKEAFTSETLLAIRKAMRLQSIAQDVINDGENKFINTLQDFVSNSNYEAVGRGIFKLLEVNVEELTKSKNVYEQLNYWKQLVESKGIYVLELGFPISDAKGFAINHATAPFIVLNTNDFPNSRIFTLLHELSHFIYGEDDVANEEDLLNFNSANQTEVACNYIAGSILVPTDLLDAKIRTLNLNFSEIDIDMDVLARIFNVSREVILRRLLINRVITSDDYNKIQQLLVNNHKPKKPVEGGNFYIKYLKNNSRYFVTKILESYGNNRIDYADMLDYLSIKSETLTKLQQRI